MDHIVELDRRQRKRQAVHQSLLDAAAELFRARGVARTTIDDIAEAADVARQTLFNHFPYKEAIVLELMADTVEEIACRAQALLEVGIPALEVLQRVAEWILDAAKHERELMLVAVRELLHADTERAARAAARMPISDLFEAILVQAREEGAIREDLPLGIVAARLSETVRLTLMQVGTDNVEQLRRELAVCYDMMFNGIRRRD